MCRAIGSAESVAHDVQRRRSRVWTTKNSRASCLGLQDSTLHLGIPTSPERLNAAAREKSSYSNQNGRHWTCICRLWNIISRSLKHQGVESLGIRQRVGLRFKDEIEFLKGWKRNRTAVGAITPTSAATARRMASVIHPGSGLPVLELGPGTGVITKAILARGVLPREPDFDRVFTRVLRPPSRAIPDSGRAMRRCLCTRSHFGRAAKRQIRLRHFRYTAPASASCQATRTRPRPA